MYSRSSDPGALPVCYDGGMKRIVLLAVLVASSAPGRVRAQASSGALEFSARVTPTAARPEPVREFTFYVLTKSYREIVKEIDQRDGPPSREQFIDRLGVSDELRDWLHKHDLLDLTLPEFEKLVTADDVLRVPEFLAAYQRSNSGGVTGGVPVAKFHEDDRKDNPVRYEKQKQEYLAALKRFVAAHPETLSGLELELQAVNPARKWAEQQSAHRRRVEQLAPAEAQTKYLAAKTDTDLEGRARVAGLPPGVYWISSLGLAAAAGDARLEWDVPVKVSRGETFRIELTNLNATDNLSSKTR
jgi:hypothetical protein